MRLNQKIVLITGATSGIGEACARQFAEAGASILLCARRVDVLNQLAKQLIDQYGVAVHVFKLDVSQSHAVEAAFAALPKEWQKIDILINNAGLAAGLETIQAGEIADWEVMIDTNIKGLLYVTKAVLPKMVERDVGHIINIGSIAGHQIYAKGAVYCATKHAVNALSQGLRLDLSGTKIRVSTVDPGAVETNFSVVRFRGDSKRAASVYEGMEPLTANDIANAVLYCATRPPHVNVSEIIIMPTDQAAINVIARKKNG